MYPQEASPYGICDLSGNVWEWCLNKYDHPERIQEAGTDMRALRGGSWGGPYVMAAAVVRSGNLPNFWYFLRGFRVVVGFGPVS